MASSGRKRRRKKNKKNKRLLFGIEMVILAVLTVVLLGSIWVTHKFSLLNHQDLDDDKVFTADELNKNQGNGESENGLEGVELIALVGLDTRGEYTGQNSDTMIIACINHNDKTIKLVSLYRDTLLNISYPDEEPQYTKANAAYAQGGPEQMLTMMNTNLDLNITHYLTVDFMAVAKVVDALGGLDVDMTREEAIHLNNYNVETAEACGVEYEELELPSKDVFDGAITQTFHLNGSQAVSYARIRKTAGNDFRRTARQRKILELIFEKAKTADLGTLDSIMNQVFPLVTTDLSNTKILSLIQPLLSYTITSEQGFPFHQYSGSSITEVTGVDCVLPVTLEYNVKELHELLFPGESYTPSQTVVERSDYLINLTGYGESDIPDVQSDVDLPPSLSYEEAEQQGLLDNSDDDYYGDDYSDAAYYGEEDSYDDEGYSDDYYDSDYYDQEGYGW